jgi:hypothetical protein
MAPQQAQLHVVTNNSTKYEHILSYGFRGVAFTRSYYVTLYIVLKLHNYKFCRIKLNMNKFLYMVSEELRSQSVTDNRDHYYVPLLGEHQRTKIYRQQTILNDDQLSVIIQLPFKIFAYLAVYWDYQSFAVGITLGHNIKCVWYYFSFATKAKFILILFFKLDFTFI